MEQKHVLLSALSVGVGVGVGLGLSSGQKWVGGNRDSDELSVEQIVQELKNLVVEGRDGNVTFEDFPYYLRWFWDFIAVEWYNMTQTWCYWCLCFFFLFSFLTIWPCRMTFRHGIFEFMIVYFDKVGCQRCFEHGSLSVWLVSYLAICYDYSGRYKFDTFYWASVMGLIS